jgi:hypothetical protein
MRLTNNFRPMNFRPMKFRPMNFWPMNFTSRERHLPLVVIPLPTNGRSLVPPPPDSHYTILTPAMVSVLRIFRAIGLPRLGRDSSCGRRIHRWPFGRIASSPTMVQREGPVYIIRRYTGSENREGTPLPWCCKGDENVRGGLGVDGRYSAERGLMSPSAIITKQRQRQTLAAASNQGRQSFPSTYSCVSTKY